MRLSNADPRPFHVGGHAAHQATGKAVSLGGALAAMESGWARTHADAAGPVADRAHPRPLGALLTEAHLHKLESREAAFRVRVAHQLATRSLDHLKIGEMIGKGGAKEAYELPGTDLVLVVQSELSPRLFMEIIDLHRLRSRNFPVVELRDFGKYKGQHAMVMEKLHDVTKPSSPNTFSGRAFVNSPFANRRTLDSLVHIRNALLREKIDILDLQYGFREDGSLRIFDPLSLLSSRGNPGDKPMTDTLDQLIAALQARFPRQLQAA